jgi:hypothetical protein
MNSVYDFRSFQRSNGAWGYRVTIRLSRFKLCYWSLLEAPVCAYSVSFSWEKRLWCM